MSLSRMGLLVCAAALVAPLSACKRPESAGAGEYGAIERIAFNQRAA